jgi:hypothetical protein
MMHRSTRGIRVSALVAMAAVLPTLHACYEYKPLETQTPPVGDMIALQITDQGRIDLAERFGPGLAEIQGRVVANQGNEYVVNVFRVSQLNGETAAWSGEVTHINRTVVGMVKGRQLSPVRTTLLAVGGAVAVGYLATRALSGGFSGGGDSPSTTPLPASIRIPVRLHF